MIIGNFYYAHTSSPAHGTSDGASTNQQIYFIFVFEPEWVTKAEPFPWICVKCLIINTFRLDWIVALEPFFPIQQVVRFSESDSRNHATIFPLQSSVIHFEFTFHFTDMHGPKHVIVPLSR